MTKKGKSSKPVSKRVSKPAPRKVHAQSRKAAAPLSATKTPKPPAARRDFMIPASEQFNKATTTVMTAYEEMGSLARDHLDATMKSAAAVTKGWDELTRSTSGMLQDSLARAMSASKTILGARNLREITDLHNELCKDFFDNWVTSTGKLSEISARVTQDVVAPIAEHTNNAFSKIAQKVKKAA